MTSPSRHEGLSDALTAVLAPSSLDLAELIALVTAESASEGALLMTVGASGLTVAASYPRPPDPLLVLPVGFGVMGLVAANGKGVLLTEDAPRDDRHRAQLGLAPGRSISRVCAPVVGLPGSVVGVLSLHRSEPYGAADLADLTQLSAVLGLRLEAERLAEHERLRHHDRDSLIAQAISAQEAERRRIAGDLHDGVTQALVSLDYHLVAASGFLPGRVEEATAEIATARSLSALAFDETRAAISGLHSLILDDLGIVAALESLAQSVPLDVAYTGERSLDLPNHAAAALYRIAQEALNNAVRHARAAHALVSLRSSQEEVVLTITDDGVGFDATRVRPRAAPGEAEHFGLASIAERCALIGAELRIDSAEGRGTAVTVTLPTA